MKNILLILSSTAVVATPIATVVGSEENVGLSPIISPDDKFSWHDFDEQVANSDRDPDVWYKNYATPTYKEYDHEAAYEHAKLNGWTSEEYQKFLRYVHEKTRLPEQGDFGVVPADVESWIGVHWGMDDSRFDTSIQGSPTSPAWENAFKEGFVGENEKQLTDHNASSTWHAYDGGIANFWLFDSNNYDNAWLRLIDQKRLIKADAGSIDMDDSYLEVEGDESSRVERNKYIINGEVFDKLPLGKTFYYVTTDGVNFVRDYNGWRILVTDENKERVFSDVLNPASREALTSNVKAGGVELDITGANKIDEISISVKGGDPKLFKWDETAKENTPGFSSWTFEINEEKFNANNEHLKAKFVHNDTNASGGVVSTSGQFSLEDAIGNVKWEIGKKETVPSVWVPTNYVIGNIEITPDPGYEFDGNGIGNVVSVPVTTGDIGKFTNKNYQLYYYPQGHDQDSGNYEDYKNSWDLLNFVNSEKGIEAEASTGDGFDRTLVNYDDGEKYVVHGEHGYTNATYADDDDASYWYGLYVMTHKETGDSALDALDKLVQDESFVFPVEFVERKWLTNKYGRVVDMQGNYWGGRGYSWAFVEDGNGGYKLWKDANVFGVEVSTWDRFSNMEINYTTPQYLFGGFHHVFVTKLMWEASSYYDSNPW